MSSALRDGLAFVVRVLRASARLNALLPCAVIALASACDVSFSPDWGPMNLPDLIDGGGDDLPPAPPPPDAGQDAGADAEADGAAGDASSPHDAGSWVPAPNCMLVDNCVDAGAACVRMCIAPCAELPCEPGVPCQTAGPCMLDCRLCAVPPIR